MTTERMKLLAQKIQQWDIKQGVVPQEWLDEYGKLWAEETNEKNYQKELKSKEMRNRRRRGNYGEKKVAKELGMERKGGVGMLDAGNSMYSAEVKTVKKIPMSIEKILSQSRRLAKKGTIAIGAFRCGRRVVVVFEGTDFTDVTGQEVK